MRLAGYGVLAVARSLRRDSNGSAFVEGAIVVPVLFVLLFGVYEFSWFFYQQHVISTGLRDAARYLARSPDACNDGSPIWSTAEENAKKLATTGLISGGSGRVRGWTSAMVVPRCEAIDNSPPARGPSLYRGRPIIYVVIVSTRFIDPSLGFFQLLNLPIPIISVAHSERVIGPG